MKSVKYLFLSGIAFFTLCCYAEANEPKITLLYKLSSGDSDRAYILNEGDPLLTGAKVRIVIKEVPSGTYSLLLENSKKEKIVLKEEFNVKKVTNLFIPSENGWMTLGQNTGKFKLRVTKTSGDSISSFDFIILPKQHKTLTKFPPNMPLEKGNLKDLPKVSIDLKEFEIFANLINSINKKDLIQVTRGAGAEIYRKYAKAVPIVYDVPLTGYGSGIIINKDGEVITNYHVIEGLKNIWVYLKPDGHLNLGQNYSRRVKLINVDVRRDLAHLKIIAPPSDLTFVKLGSNSKIEIAEEVHAIGHPSEQVWTYTKGIVSQVRPNYKWNIEGREYQATVIQTQTPLNPGNSGGPLFSEDGYVIGINTWNVSNTEGIHFAVSVDEIKQFYSESPSNRESKLHAPGKKCKEKTLAAYDTNNNGTIDQYSIDYDCDGKEDYIVKDENEDGIADSAHYDLNKDGKIDVVVEYNQDEWMAYIDSDYDGFTDQVWTDYDKDGIWDKKQKL